MRSRNVSRQLTEEDAVEICRRRLRGEAQHLLAAEYGVNPARVSEVLSGKRFPNARATANSEMERRAAPAAELKLANNK